MAAILDVAGSMCGWFWGHELSECHVRRYLNGSKSDELYEGALDTGCRVSLDMGACGLQEVGFFHQHSDGVDWIFVDHPSYHRAGVPHGPCSTPSQGINQVLGNNFGPLSHRLISAGLSRAC